MNISKPLFASLMLLTSLFAFSKQDGEFLRMEQTDFPINTTMLEEMNLTNTSYYSVSLMSAEELQKGETQTFVELDFLKLLRLKKQSHLVSKHAYMLNRPADFWSCALLDNSKYMRALISSDVNKVKKMKYHVEGKKKFDVAWAADFNDCTETLGPDLERNFSFLKSVDTQFSLELHGTFVKETGNFNKGHTQGWAFTKVYRFPTNKKEKTLVITYEVTAMPERNMLKNIVISEQINQMDQTEAANAKFEVDNNSGRMD